MKRTLKKSMALLLTLCMVLSLVPAMGLTALAAATEYNTWVGGVRVTSENMSDVLGDGTVIYTPAVGTVGDAGYVPAILALSGTHTFNGTSARYGAGIYAEFPLTIDLAESADITVNAGAEGIGSAAIYGTGNLTIQGSGTLTANGADIASGIGYSTGIASQTLEIKGTVSVTATGGSVTNIDGRNAGVSGTVATNSMGFAVVTVSGGSLTAIGDTTTDSYAHGIYGSLITTGTVLSGAAAPGDANSTDYSVSHSAMSYIYINVTFPTPGEDVPTPALSALTVSAGEDELTISPEFAKSVSYYSVTVPNTTESVTIAAAPDADSVIDAVSSDLGEKSLNVGENSFAVVATKNGQTLIYHITVTRQQALAVGDLELASFSLTPQGGGSFPCDGVIDHTAGTINIALGAGEKAQELLVGFAPVNVDAIVTYDDGTSQIQTSGTSRVTLGDAVPTVTVSYGGQSKVYDLTVTENGAAVQNYGLGVKTAADGHYSVGDTVTYELYATAPITATTSAMDIGAFQFTMSYDTSLTYVGFTAEFGADADAENSVTDGVLKLGYTAQAAVPVPYDAAAGKGYVKLGDITFTVDSDIPETTTALTDAVLTEVEVTPNGYDKNNGTVTEIADADSAFLHNNIATFANTAHTTGASGKAYIKYNTPGLFTNNTYSAAFTLPTVAAVTSYRLAADTKWHVAGDGGQSADVTETNLLNSSVYNGGEVLYGNLTITANTVEQVSVIFNVNSGKGYLGAPGTYTQTVLIDKNAPILDSDPTPTVTADNYSFAGWTTVQDGTEVTVTGETLAAAETTLYAVIAPHTYTLTIEDALTNQVTETGITDGQTITYNTPITFTLSQSADEAKEYFITAVEYSVGDDNYRAVPFVEGAYTIAGTNITDDVTIRITTNRYHTLTFRAGNGVTDTGFRGEDGTIYPELYVVHNTRGAFYSDKACTQEVTIVVSAVDTATIQDDGGRYRAITVAEQFFDSVSLDTTYSIAWLLNKDITEDMVLTANATKQYPITFKVAEIGAGSGVYGANFGVEEGTPIREISKWLDTGTSIYNNTPAVTIEPGFTEGAWQPEIDAGNTTALAPTTYIYTATVGKYNVIFDETAVTYSDKTGLDEDAKATHGTDVTFKVAEKINAAPGETSYHLVSVGYTVYQGKTGTLTPDENGVYTVPGADIVGYVNITPVYVRYVTVTLTPGDGAAFTPNETVTAYAKYNVAGLYTDTACQTAFSGFPTVSAKENYRLRDTEQYWVENVGDMNRWNNDGVQARALTGNTAYTVDAYQTVTINFTAPVNGVITNYVATVTFTPDMALGGSIGYLFGNGNETANTGYTYTGWTHDNGTPLNTGDDVFIPETTLALKATKLAWLETGSYTFTANFEANTYRWYDPVFTNAGYDITYSDDGFDGVDTTNPQTGYYQGGAVYAQDITFKLSASSGAAIRVNGVSYTVGGGTATTLHADENGLYTIPGETILGDIRLTVNAAEYVTITFQAGTGVSMETDTAIALKGVAGFYENLDAFVSGTAGYTVPVPEADTGYRLKNDYGENLWLDGGGSEYTSAQLDADPATVSFSADATLTAQSVKQWTVTFAAGEHGSLTGETTMVVDDGYVLSEYDAIPEPTPDTGYELDQWSANPVGAVIEADTTFTASFKPGTYTITFVGGNVADITAVSGINTEAETYTVTYGTDATFKVTNKTGKRVTEVCYNIGGEGESSIGSATDEYTLTGGMITANIVITVYSVDTYVVSFTAGSNGSLSGTTSFVIDKDITLGRDYTNLNGVLRTPATGYEFKQWRLGTTGGTVMTEAEILAAPVTAAVTYVAEFTLAQRTVTDTNSVIASSTGTTGTSPRIATYGTDVVVTVVNDKLVTGVNYRVQTGPDTWSDPVAAVFDPEAGTYTIPGSVITGNLEVIGNVLNGVSMEFILRDEYKAITAETLGRKILVLNGAIAGNTYKLADGTTLYWSSQYNAAVCWVPNSATAASLAPGMTVLTGTAATAIAYGGDINMDGNITAADAGIISDCLHDQRLVRTSAMQLFMLDVESTGSAKGVNGYKQVTAADITKTLITAVS